MALVNGSADGNNHPYVVFVGQNAPPRMACSGTIVAPRVVVTAAHCAATAGESMTVITGEQALPPNPANVYAGTFQPHPKFCVACPGSLFGQFGANDVAVVLLDRDAPGPYAKLPRLGTVLFSYLFRPASMTLVGYGFTSMPPTANLGVRHQGFAKGQVLRKYLDFIELPAQQPGSKFASHCFGDSGGPALRGKVVIGVVSVGDDACLGPSYLYRLDTLQARLFLSKYVDTRRSEGNDDDERDNDRDRWDRDRDRDDRDRGRRGDDD